MSVEDELKKSLRTIFTASRPLPPLVSKSLNIGGLEMLSPDAFHIIDDFLRARSRHALSVTCVARCSATRESGRVAGIATQLWPHQRDSCDRIGMNDRKGAFLLLRRFLSPDPYQAVYSKLMVRFRGDVFSSLLRWRFSSGRRTWHRQDSHGHCPYSAGGRAQGIRRWNSPGST